MSWTNYHGHCHFCDGNGKPEEYVLAAMKKGMHAIGFSSHAPVPFDSFWNMQACKLESYCFEIERLKSTYNQYITIHKSLEIDYIEGVMGPSDNEFKQLNLDYTIGSVHFMGKFKNDEYWAIDGSFDSFKHGLSEIFQNDIKTLVRNFFEQQRQMIFLHRPTIIGHLDKIKMHNAIEFCFDEKEQWYKDEVRALLEVIAKKGIIVEINTKSLSRNGMLFPGVEHFKWLKELNIPVVINSDAHYPEHLDAGFEMVASLLQANGIYQLACLKKGRWNLFSFDNSGLRF